MILSENSLFHLGETLSTNTMFWVITVYIARYVNKYIIYNIFPPKALLATIQHTVYCLFVFRVLIFVPVILLLLELTLTQHNALLISDSKSTSRHFCCYKQPWLDMTRAPPVHPSDHNVFISLLYFLLPSEPIRSTLHATVSPFLSDLFGARDPDCTLPA